MIVQQPTSSNDEIDLVELFRALWRQKILIASITLLVTLLAALYAFWRRRTFKLEPTFVQCRKAIWTSS